MKQALLKVFLVFTLIVLTLLLIPQYNIYVAQSRLESASLQAQANKLLRESFTIQMNVCSSPKQEVPGNLALSPARNNPAWNQY